MTVQIERTENTEACFAIRMDVFVGEQGISLAEEFDDFDGDAVHLVATDGDEFVGTARLIIEKYTGKIGRVCVVKSHRGTGLGAKLVKAGLEIFIDRPDITRAYLSAQVNAIGFYEKLGFRAYGEAYDDAGIPHRDMEKTL